MNHKTIIDNEGIKLTIGKETIILNEKDALKLAEELRAAQAIFRAIRIKNIKIKKQLTDPKTAIKIFNKQTPLQ